MTHRKNPAILAILILSVSLLTASVTAALLTKYYDHAYTQALGFVCQSIIESVDDAATFHVEQTVLSALKQFQYDPGMPEKQNLLASYGYRQSAFMQSVKDRGRLLILLVTAAGGILFFIAACLWHRRENERIDGLTDYLERVNTSRDGSFLQVGEGALARLQDEIYKTVTALQQSKDAALAAKHNFAENLYNIAHQLKTPITSISLSVQMLCHEMSSEHLIRITGQLGRLTRLEEALLLLSRIDTGTLTLERTEVDVFTLLMLAAENLQQLFLEKNITVEIPEAEEMSISADMDWTMEAVMNLLKNCLEHTPSGGSVFCAYEQNPLYTLIRIQDTGSGFAKEDLPHIFERFYRGKDAAGGGVGIGLALSKAIIERQNGILSARNLPAGGACFEIRFYR